MNGRAWPMRQPRCDIADVIVCGRDRSAAQGRNGLVTVLHQFPGCVVVVGSVSEREALVVVRGDGLVSLTARGHFMPRETEGLGWLACGVFIYGWLCAGLRLPALDAEVIQVMFHDPPESGVSLTCAGNSSRSLSVFWDFGRSELAQPLPDLSGLRRVEVCVDG